MPAVDSLEPADGAVAGELGEAGVLHPADHLGAGHAARAALPLGVRRTGAVVRRRDHELVADRFQARQRHASAGLARLAHVVTAHGHVELTADAAL